MSRLRGNRIRFAENADLAEQNGNLAPALAILRDEDHAGLALAPTQYSTVSPSTRGASSLRWLERSKPAVAPHSWENLTDRATTWLFTQRLGKVASPLRYTVVEAATPSIKLPHPAENAGQSARFERVRAIAPDFPPVSNDIRRPTRIE
jgi:hypothetical protein